jgi:hypothetical protein
MRLRMSRGGAPVSDDEDRHGREHLYDVPASVDGTRSRSWDYVLLAVLVVIIVVLIATGVVPLLGI